MPASAITERRSIRGPPYKEALLVDDRGLHHRSEAIAQLDAVGITYLHHVNCDELLLGIDPEQRAGIARPAVFTDRARYRRIADPRAHLEAQSEAQPRRTARPRAGVVRGHEGERLLADHALALKGAAI